MAGSAPRRRSWYSSRVARPTTLARVLGCAAGSRVRVVEYGERWKMAGLTGGRAWKRPGANDSEALGMWQSHTTQGTTECESMLIPTAPPGQPVSVDAFPGSTVNAGGRARKRPGAEDAEALAMWQNHTKGTVCELMLIPTAPPGQPCSLVELAYGVLPACEATSLGRIPRDVRSALRPACIPRMAGSAPRRRSWYSSRVARPTTLARVLGCAAGSRVRVVEYGERWKMAGLTGGRARKRPGARTPRRSMWQGH